MTMRLRLAVAVALCALGAAVEAHHSLSGMYDQSRRVMVEGTISQYQFVNPHPFVMIDVTDASGATQSWKAEMDNRRELLDVGVTATTIKPGDRVLVTGSPGRTSTPPLLYVW